jgi:hypothetical protein
MYRSSGWNTFFTGWNTSRGEFMTSTLPDLMTVPIFSVLAFDYTV